MVQWLEYGGVMLIPLALASLLGVALFIARWRALLPQRVLPGDLRIRVLRSVEEGQWDKALHFTAKEPSALGRIYHEALRYRTVPRPELRDAVQEVGRREMVRLERFVGAVEAALGAEGLHRALAHPENLPDGDELANPSRWLARTTEGEDVPDDLSALFGELGDAPHEGSADERIAAAGRGEPKPEPEPEPEPDDDEDEDDAGDDA